MNRPEPITLMAAEGVPWRRFTGADLDLH